MPKTHKDLTSRKEMGLVGAWQLAQQARDGLEALPRQACLSVACCLQPCHAPAGISRISVCSVQLQFSLGETVGLVSELTSAFATWESWVETSQFPSVPVCGEKALEENWVSQLSLSPFYCCEETA